MQCTLVEKLILSRCGKPDCISSVNAPALRKQARSKKPAWRMRGHSLNGDKEKTLYLLFSF
jgi:hypothetical protein